VQADTPLPPQPTPARVQEQQQRVHQRRHERYQTIQQLVEQGWTQDAIADKLGIARQTVYRYLKMPQGPVVQRQTKRRSILDPYKAYLLERWNAGCYNGLQLFRELQAQGFRGTDGTVRRYITQLRKAAGLPPRSRNGAAHPLASDPTPQMPSLTALCWQILRKPETRTADEQWSIKQLREGHVALAEVIGLAEEFANLVRQRKSEQFHSWLERASRCKTPMFETFACGLEADDAVRAALTVPYSNGPTEGHINRLKCLKRQMYGRAKLDLLRQRLLAA
jgi:transposase